MTANYVVGIIFLVIALLLLGFGGAAASKRLPGNKFVGLHVAEVRESKEIWDAAHQVTGYYVILASVAMAFGAAFAFIADGWLWLGPAIGAVAALVSISVGANLGAKTASLLKHNEQAAQEDPAPKASPTVDTDALRRAAFRADERGKDGGAAAQG